MEGGMHVGGYNLEQFLFYIQYNQNKMLFFQTFFVNNFLMKDERQLKFVLEVTQVHNLDNIC